MAMDQIAAPSKQERITMLGAEESYKPGRKKAQGDAKRKALQPREARGM